MYQTVGHSGLESIAAALDLPLFTHTIQGQPINQESEYGSRQGTYNTSADQGTVGDETEDLLQLLLQVKVRDSLVKAHSSLLLRS